MSQVAPEKEEAIGELIRMMRSNVSEEALALVTSALIACFAGEQVAWRAMIPPIDFVVKGQVPSKSNCYSIVTIPRRNKASFTHLAKKPELKRYELSFARQVPIEFRAGQVGHFVAILHVFESSRRPDLDNAGKVVFDCLQKVTDRKYPEVNLTGVIANDRYLRNYHVFWGLAPNNPRVRIQILPFQDELPWLTT